MAFIRIEYKEPNPTGYSGVYISIRSDNADKEQTFNSGDLEKDWYDAMKVYMASIDEDPRLSASSSVDHYFMDGGDEFYESRYLKYDEKNLTWELSTEYGDGFEFFVKKGTYPTWKEMKDLYGR